MKNELSGIWKQVFPEQPSSTLQDLAFDNLIDTAKFVIDSEKPEYAFRRNRELVDLSHRFRFFCFQGINYVLKLTKPNEIPIEYVNALRLDKRIKDIGLTKVHVVIPQLIQSDTDGTIGLLQEDHGFTLYESIEQTQKRIDLREMMSLYGTLLNNGIEWSGWLPRNMFMKNDELWLIDFEDVYFHGVGDYSISDLTLFKLILGWGQIFEKDDVCAVLDEVVGELKISTAFPDSFEKVLSCLLNNGDYQQVREIGFKFTYLSELPLRNYPTENKYLTSMDIGHLVEDIFDNDYLSVWYTVGTSKIRRQYGEQVYANFLLSFEHALVTWLKESVENDFCSTAIKSLRQMLLCLLIRFFSSPDENIYIEIMQAENISSIIHILESSSSCVTSIMRFLRSRSCKGWEAAIARSRDVHCFLSQIYTLLTWSFPALSEHNLLLRGSCAQGLMSIHSDIDFEISNKEYPMGFIPAENLLSSILTVFDLDHEGSTARPTEIDLISSDGYTRDFHEWTELVIPNSSVPDKGWINGLFSADTAWHFYSEYESQKHNLTPKYLFFRIRAMIERYALQYSIAKTFTDEKIKELSDIADFIGKDTLFSVTKRCLDCYESSTIDFNEMLELNQYIDVLYAHAEIRYHE